MRNLLRSISQNQDGATAVEFAIIAPVFIALVFGIIGVSFALFLVGSLHFAVEDGARCASAKVGVCPDAATTQAYTQSRYLWPNISPTFTPNLNAACGKSVTGSVNYSMNVGFRTFVIPISATACYP